MREKQHGTKRQHSPRWSDDEVARLRSLAKRMRIDEISKALNRSRGAVTAKAFTLRLSLDVDHGSRGWSRTRPARARASE